MKILFVSLGDQPDYQCDCLYHGLKSLIGRELESTADMWYMYETLHGDDRKYLYGNGFTLYGLLKNGLKNVPKPQTVISNIQTHYYSSIIFGTIIKDDTLLRLVIENYSPGEIIFVDGEDGAYIDKHLTTKGKYFKRELLGAKKNIYPISFGIPEEKIVKIVPAKFSDWALNYPGKLDTYVYKDEDLYYKGYQNSRFAVTTKKEGWDCLRHYEIIANGCIPYFKDIESCPTSTMINFPKDILKEINRKIENQETVPYHEFEHDVEILLSFCRENLTTEAIAKSMLETLVAEHKETKELGPSNNAGENLICWNFKIDKLLKLTGPEIKKNAVLVYSGVSSIQDIRFLTDKYTSIYATDIFGSAMISLKSVLDEDLGKVKFADDIFSVQEHADTIILEFTLSYQENIIDYLRHVKNLMNLNARLILIVPNSQTIINLLAFIKGDFRFGKIKLSKKAPVNFYSKKSLCHLLKSFGFKVNEISGYDVESNHLIKRLFNKIAFLKFWNSKMLIIDAFLNEEQGLYYNSKL